MVCVFILVCQLLERDSGRLMDWLESKKEHDIMALWRSGIIMNIVLDFLMPKYA